MPGIELTKTFRPECYAGALESWGWIGLGGRAPLFASLFGDVFLEDDQGLSMLSVIDGSLMQHWPDRAALDESLASDEGRDAYLLAGLALAAHERGTVLEPHQVYDFQPPPALGGVADVDHIVATDFVVAVNINGQIHDQVRRLTPGSQLRGVRVS